MRLCGVHSSNRNDTSFPRETLRKEIRPLMGQGVKSTPALMMCHLLGRCAGKTRSATAKPGPRGQEHGSSDDQSIRDAPPMGRLGPRTCQVQRLPRTAERRGSALVSDRDPPRSIQPQVTQEQTCRCTRNYCSRSRTNINDSYVEGALILFELNTKPKITT
ncbi:hypothetical protein NDU88_006586 [Pleurodeles waltl]|uniref:Uncharacterized protein n=1 Tax=Pleurodeles waltl TaxID=8319 RepID=A0AAV7LPK0_PLEWA|nr:hypothetical protein NDU88_006586 [Pleurodeles waltl]